MVTDDRFLCTKDEEGEINEEPPQENRFLVPRDVFLLPLV
jgi:hypothetical protein